MNQEPLIDVIIPCFNGSKYIQQSVDSVLKQTIRVSKILFVNDGSRDNSLEVIERLAASNPSIHILSQPNSGLSSARNLGINNSEAEFVSFLDVDDYWLPEKLENQMLKYRGPGFAIASNYLEECNGVISKGVYNSGRHRIKPRDLLTFRRVIPGSGSSVLFDRIVIDECGLFDEELRYGEDLDYWVRVASKFSWIISESRDVVIHKNPTGMQAQKAQPQSYFLRDSLVLINRYKHEITRIESAVLARHLEFASRRSLKLLIKKPGLFVGATYSLYLRVLRFLQRVTG